jgi:MFS family permease
MTLSAFALYAVVVNLVPLLTGRGLSPTAAAWALGLGGAGQVAGRLGYKPLLAHAGVRGRIAAVMAAGAASVLFLALLPGPPGLLFAVAILTGVVRGMFTLLEATIVSDYWGPAGYASLNGIFSAPLTAATAVAPTVGAAAATATGGYPELFAVLAGSGVASAGLALAAGPEPGRTRAAHGFGG